MIVIPFSRSRSMESITRSGTAWCSRKMPLCFSIASTSVVLPWSTWAMIATLRMSRGLMRAGGLCERTLEQLPDGTAAVILQEPCPGSGKPGMADAKGRGVLDFPPPVFLPREPAVPVLVEDEDRLVAELGELGAPARAAAYGPVRQDLPDDVDLLAGVDLVPHRLQ